MGRGEEKEGGHVRGRLDVGNPPGAQNGAMDDDWRRSVVSVCERRVCVANKGCRSWSLVLSSLLAADGDALPRQKRRRAGSRCRCRVLQKGTLR